mmetsp:Transcript_3041/g.8371  ORF Transcript_3041/g.8371 Transcript_3041/m.8371 type:complete len:160 (-) Transcript_3041:81-560(-)|eukprot:CAMPEP_0172370470 /NCGR_PEP_ID=MMETSP1060-20121228/37825_1 /TAXON_ID=37318 /ORGANISM="Pseudo-nitzschia pungens, Strain cf. cingulata" /LENGTH=159 /DNA_ID=CAMNT_0013095743 /DNA_START=104 /DNA_END=583 /DNA_ORIENTATION=-
MASRALRRLSNTWQGSVGFRPCVTDHHRQCGTVVPNRRWFGSKDDPDDSKDSSSSGPRSPSSLPSPSPSLGSEWRKKQLDQLERRFTGKQLEARNIESEDELQPMWKEMEGRVTRRKLRTLADTGGRTGRRNVKQTDEDVWLREGLYGSGSDKPDDSEK